MTCEAGTGFFAHAFMSAPAGTFHFLGSSGATVDEQLATDIATAAGFSVPQLVSIVNLVVECLKSPKARAAG